MTRTTIWCEAEECPRLAATTIGLHPLCAAHAQPGANPRFPTMGPDSPPGTATELPLLGLATTRELLAELEARGATCEHTANEGLAGAVLELVASGLLGILPAPVLDYRTVDG